MLPFPGLSEIKIQWLAIQQGNYKLYGFLIYTGTDTVIVEFLKEGILDLDVLSGNECAIFLIEPPSKKWINYVRKSGHPWAKFFSDLIDPAPRHATASQPKVGAEVPGTVTIQDEPPSKKWINYVRKSGHPWAKFFSDLIDPAPRHATASQPKVGAEVPGMVTIQDITNSVVILGNDNHVLMNQLLEPDYDALFDRSEAYKVAEHFNIATQEIPCLIFFKDIDDHLIWMQQLDDYNTPKSLKVFFRNFFNSPAFHSLFA